METIRVAWVNQFDPLHPWAGGAERHIAEVSKGLVRLGNDVTVFAERFHQSPREEWTDGVKIIRPGSRLGIHLWATEYFRHTTDFDVVVRDLSKVLPWGPVSSWRAPSVAIVRHINGSVLVREVPFAALGLWAVERSYSRILRDVPVITEARVTAQRLALLGVPLSHVALVRPGVDKAVFSPDAGARSPYPLILYAGRLKKYKRVDLAIRAYSHLRQKLPESRMVVAGEGDDAPRLHRLAEEMGVAPFIEFSGKVATQELVRLYRRAWLHVQPSSAEGWGLTVMEAAACGTPTVAMSGTALDESVGPDCQGYLVHAPNSQKLADSMARCVLDMSAGSTVLGKKMVEYASHFEWTEATKTFDGIVRRVSQSARWPTSWYEEAVAPWTVKSQVP